MSQAVLRTVVRGLTNVRLVPGPSLRLQTVPKRLYAAVMPSTDFVFRPVRKL